MKPGMIFFMHFFGVVLGGRVLYPNAMLPYDAFLRTLSPEQLLSFVSLFATRLHSAYI